MSEEKDLEIYIEAVKEHRMAEVDSFLPDSYVNSTKNLVFYNDAVLESYLIGESIDTLQNMYIEMEMQRFEYVSQNVCYGAYIASRGMSCSETGNGLYGAEIPDEVANRCEDLSSRNPFMMISDYLEETGGEKNVNGLPYCARMVGLNVYAISTIMELPNPTKDVYTPGAVGIISGGYAGGKDCPPLCGDDYKHLKEDNSGPKLNTLIKNGKIKAGDAIAWATGSSGSGHHALTVAAVDCDNNGKIISYTLMDNNGGKERTRLVTVDINDTYSPFNKAVHYTSVNEWGRDEITKKANQMSREELIKAICKSRSDLYYEIDLLAKTETEVFKGECFDETRRDCFKRQQNALIVSYMNNADKLKGYYRDPGSFSFGYALVAQNESSIHALENNKYLINNNIYGNVGDGNRIDQALARREGNAIGTDPELTSTGNLTTDDLRRINANNNSRA